MSIYGYCPICGKPGISRERRMNGDDKCSAGHTYPSCKSKPLTITEFADINDEKNNTAINERSKKINLQKLKKLVEENKERVDLDEND